MEKIKSGWNSARAFKSLRPLLLAAGLLLNPGAKADDEADHYSSATFTTETYSSSADEISNRPGPNKEAIAKLANQIQSSIQDLRHLAEHCNADVGKTPLPSNTKEVYDRLEDLLKREARFMSEIESILSEKDGHVLLDDIQKFIDEVGKDPATEKALKYIFAGTGCLN